jgi:hypothetical protein
MAQRESTTVRFRITSATLSADQIKTQIGLEADETWKLGDKRGPFAVVEKVHGYVLESKAFPMSSLDEHLKAMIKRLAPSAQKIGAIAPQCVIEFICALTVKKVPSLRFERDDLRWLGVMGARLHVDMLMIEEPVKPAGGAAGGTGAGAPPKTGN